MQGKMRKCFDWNLLDVSGCTVKCGSWQIFEKNEFSVLCSICICFSLKGLLATILFLHTLYWLMMNCFIKLIIWSDCGYVKFLKFYISRIWTIWVQVLFVHYVFLFESLIIYCWKFSTVVTCYLEICLCWDLCISIVHFIEVYLCNVFEITVLTI